MSIFSVMKNLFGTRESRKTADEPQCLSEIFGWVTEEMHPKARGAKGYKKKLRPAVIHACQYIDTLVKEIPGPADIRLEKWEDNPLVNAFFVTSDQVREFAAKSPNVQMILKKNSPGAYYAFLTMSKTETKNFGTEMQGDLVKRDVMHTAVTFRNHRMDAVFPSEEELRKDLRKRGMKLLMAFALEHILSLEEWITELEEQKHLLEIKLQISNVRQRSLAPFPVSGTEEFRKNREAAGILKKIEEKLALLHAQLHSPEDYLNQVIKILMHPEKCLGVERIFMKISPMNILLAPDARENGTEICLAHFRMKEEQKWVGIILRIRGKNS